MQTKTFILDVINRDKSFNSTTKITKLGGKKNYAEIKNYAGIY